MTKPIREVDVESKSKDYETLRKDMINVLLTTRKEFKSMNTGRTVNVANQKSSQACSIQ